jgi:hypothetical protein
LRLPHPERVGEGLRSSPNDAQAQLCHRVEAWAGEVAALAVNMETSMCRVLTSEDGDT